MQGQRSRRAEDLPGADEGSENHGLGDRDPWHWSESPARAHSERVESVRANPSAGRELTLGLTAADAARRLIAEGRNKSTGCATGGGRPVPPRHERCGAVGQADGEPTVNSSELRTSSPYRSCSQLDW